MAVHTGAPEPTNSEGVGPAIKRSNKVVNRRELGRTCDVDRERAAACSQRNVGRDENNFRGSGEENASNPAAVPPVPATQACHRFSNALPRACGFLISSPTAALENSRCWSACRSRSPLGGSGRPAGRDRHTLNPGGGPTRPIKRTTMSHQGFTSKMVPLPQTPPREVVP